MKAKVKNIVRASGKSLEILFTKLGLGMRAKLILIFLIVKVIPLVLLTVLACHQVVILGDTLREIAVSDSTDALNAGAVESIERMTTDAARRVAEFLYGRDSDILYVAELPPSEETYRQFAENKRGRLVRPGEWALSEDQREWVPAGRDAFEPSGESAPVGESSPLSESQRVVSSTNPENEDRNGFHYRLPDSFSYVSAPLYDEVAFIGLDGEELVKYVSPDSTKMRYPMDPERKNVADKKNTYIRAETYFSELTGLAPGEIYVSEVVGAYTGSNYIGMYTPGTVATASASRGYDIPYAPEAQAYAGKENPNGARFEGIVRWATPVADEDGAVIGYVTFALNHDHIMEMIDHLTPTGERYTELPNAYEGNYAFIWDYRCRSIVHPRHHSIVGYDPETGEPQVPWLEKSVYDAWQASGTELWRDFIQESAWPEFDGQSRDKTPAPELTRAGLVGLDGRYLNNAPQCTGWMDLTQNGGSGSFYILWSGLYKLTTAASIPYYTGRYSEAATGNLRGFGFVAIGAGLEDFQHPAKETELRLVAAVSVNLRNTYTQLILVTSLLIVFVVLIAVWMASFLTNNITRLISGVSRFRAGERQFRFHADVKDEFGTLADSIDDMADSIVASASGPITITDMDQRIIYVNEFGLTFRKKRLEELVGTMYADSSIYPVGSVYCPIRALEEGRRAEVYYIAERGVYVNGVATYLTDRDGKRIGYVIGLTNVTEISEERKKAEEASRAKSDFLSNMSHEMRTPMNAIIGMTAIGKAAKDTERKDYAFGKIEDASTHLLGVINDILDMSKIEANKFELSPTEFNFEKMLRKMVNVINFRVEEKKQNLMAHLDEKIPHTLVADEQRLAQVIANLLSNAVKFTPEGGSIRIGTQFLGERDGMCELKIEVADTGIGISEDQRARLFHSFEQAESNTSRKFGGTGLG
ncbi:MAG: hypothetical protein LBU58_10655, partial [Clostridiales bacterium]|nr:hypothetical protein [Clostridiales bacterium]